MAMEPAIEKDKEGFLRDYRSWTVPVANDLAEAEGIELSEAHWEILNSIRDFYNQYHISPTSRALGKIISTRLGPEKGKSIYLMQLFTGKPAKIIAKIAGLPKPNNCD